MQFYYLEDGSTVGELNGQPYNFHPLVTPEQWQWFQDQLEQGLLDEIPKPPEPTSINPAVMESDWRESEMSRAQQNVTAIDYGAQDIPGTTQQWQKYWLALRKWTETNPDFPDNTKRPRPPG